MTSQARVQTAKPSPYLKQLCKHFGHKIPAEFTDDEGSITFEFGVCRLRTDEGALLLEVEADDPERLERMENVIASHLERFGSRDELSVSWERTAAARD